MFSRKSAQTAQAHHDAPDKERVSDSSGTDLDNAGARSETLLNESDDDVLDSLSSAKGEELLAFIDHARSAYDLDKDSLDLPQLVVVGSTSCGKSSLLQALTKLPFPVESGLCTLSATETMIHRCDPSENPRYSITIETNARLDLFPPHEYSGETWSDVSHHLREDLQAAFAYLHGTNTGLEKTRRSRHNKLLEDVMKVNVYKHDQAHFSVIDIPGLVTGGSEEDQRFSEKLARQYMSKSRTIVIAVMPAVDDIHNQAVLRLVREENAIHRTIGVITKCDMLQKHDEPKTLDLLKNQNPEYKLGLGWFAVRNRTTEEIKNGISYRERDERERQLFSQKPWSILNGHSLGMANLRRCLSDTLYRLIQRSFPEVRREMSQMLELAKRGLNALGPPRDTWRLQQVYLDDIQRQYEALARKWLAGAYREDCPLNDPSKLRAHLNRLEDEFARQMEEHGMEHRYLDADKAEKRLQELDYEAFPSEWESRILATDDIFAWILRVWNENRGDGLWYKPPIDFEERLWKAQIKSWDAFAHNYFRDTSRVIQEFSDIVLEETCVDPSIRDKIRRCLQDQKLMAVSRAEQELATILSELGRMKTCHRLFKEKLQNQQGKLNAFFSYITDNKLRQIICTYENLYQFQEMALWRFLDNIVIQVVERHLLGPSGLVFCFSVGWVRNLSEKDLDYLVGEDSTQKLKRDSTQRQVRELEKLLRDSEIFAIK